MGLLLVLTTSMRGQTPPDTVQFMVMVDNISPLRVGQKLTLTYFVNREINFFSEPDLSQFNVIEGMTKKQAKQAIPQITGDSIYQTWESRDYTVSVKEPGKVVLPSTTIVVDGKNYTCQERIMTAIPPADINNVSHTWHTEPAHPNVGEPFRFILTFNTKPDEAIPFVDFWKLIRVNPTPLIISDTSRPNEDFSYSFLVKAEERGIYELPNILVHFSNKPYAVYDIKIQVGNFYEKYIGAFLILLLGGVGFVISIRKFNREGKEETAAFVIRTGRLNLDFWSAGTHFGFPVFLFSFPLLVVVFELYYTFTDDKQMIDDSVFLWMIVLPLILGVIFTYIQYQKLYLKTVRTELPKEELYKIIEEVGKTRKWIFDYVGDDCVVAHTNPGKFAASWGEQIFIVFDQGKVWVNSICDLNRRSSITSFGRTTEHIQALMKAITDKS